MAGKSITTIVIVGAALIGVSVPKVCMTIGNARNRKYVSTHSCQLFNSWPPTTHMSAGFLLRSHGSSVYTCVNPEVTVLVDD